MSGRFAVEVALEIALDEPVVDRGQVAESDLSTVGVAADDNIAEIDSTVFLAQHPHRNTQSVALELSGRDIDVDGSDGRRDLVEGDVVFEQFVRLQFDADLVVADPRQLYVADSGQQQQVVSQRLDRSFQFGLAALAEQCDADDRESRFEFLDGDPLDVFGQIGQRIDLTLDLLHQHVDVLDVAEQGQRRQADAFGNRRIDLLDTLDVVNRLLDFDRDRLLDLLGLLSRVNRSDHHLVRSRFGEELADEREGEDPAGEQDHQHQHVDQHAVVDTEACE